MPEIGLKGIPILRITDVQRATQFYEDFLGFEVDWEHYYEEGAPVYMQVSRDDFTCSKTTVSRRRPSSLSRPSVSSRYTKSCPKSQAPGTLPPYPRRRGEPCR